MPVEEGSSQHERDPDDVATQQARLEAIERRVLNVIGHELRTPVSTVRGLAEVAHDAGVDELRNEIVPALLRNARRVEALLDDLLVASEIATALPVSEPEPVDVVAAAKDAWNSRPSPAAEFAFEGSGEALITRATFRMVLDRVLDNAAKYAVGPPTFRAAVEGEHVTVILDAPGPEVHPEEVELAAEPFFRGEQAVMTAPGLGLGLSVARALVEHEGGRVFVEAGPDGGLRTVIELRSA